LTPLNLFGEESAFQFAGEFQLRVTPPTQCFSPANRKEKRESKKVKKRLPGFLCIFNETQTQVLILGGGRVGGLVN